jgi:hypothetical protein
MCACSAYQVVRSVVGAALQGPAMLIIQYEPAEPWQLAPCTHQYPPLPQWCPPRRHWSLALLCCWPSISRRAPGHRRSSYLVSCHRLHCDASGASAWDPGGLGRTEPPSQHVCAFVPALLIAAWVEHQCLRLGQPAIVPDDEERLWCAAPGLGLFPLGLPWQHGCAESHGRCWFKNVVIWRRQLCRRQASEFGLEILKKLSCSQVLCNGSCFVEQGSRARWLNESELAGEVKEGRFTYLGFLFLPCIGVCIPSLAKE